MSLSAANHPFTATTNLLHLGNAPCPGRTSMAHAFAATIG
jgi:hypothetical protein